MPPLFDMAVRAARRDRAARRGGDRFLLERAFADCLERIELVQRRFDAALLVGCLDPNWPARLSAHAQSVTIVDPGPLFAAAAGGEPVVEDRMEARTGCFDLIVAIGTLDTVDDLPAALRTLASSLKQNGLLIGAMSGGETLPRLRAAMRVADQRSGGAQAHVHPRIEPSALVHLLASTGFARPVVDVDRVRVSYPSLERLVGDLRAMAATNILAQRPRQPVLRRDYAAASAAFSAAGEKGKTTEIFEILHFAAWRGETTEPKSSKRN